MWRLAEAYQALFIVESQAKKIENSATSEEMTAVMFKMFRQTQIAPEEGYYMTVDL